jgi:hypothetical protein
VLKAFSLERLPLTLGAPVAVDLPPERLHLFDSAGHRVPT